MKELDKTKAYDLRDLNYEQRKELLNYMKSNFERWRKSTIIFDDSILIYRDDRWWQGCIEETENLEVVSGKTLFDTETNIINKQKTDKILPRMIEEKDKQLFGITTDKVVQSVMNDLNERSNVGVSKYGVTLEREDLSLKNWLQHAYEETLDKANYLKRAILEIENNEK